MPFMNYQKYTLNAKRIPFRYNNFIFLFSSEN